MEDGEQRKPDEGSMGLAEQGTRFVIVGTVCTLIDWTITIYLSQSVGIDAGIATSIGYTVSLVVNYFLSMRYVFESRDDISKTREFAVFCLLSLIGLAISWGIMETATAVFGEDAAQVGAAKMLSTVIVMLWNFLSRKAFLEKKTAQDGENVNG